VIDFSEWIRVCWKSRKCLRFIAGQNYFFQWKRCYCFAGYRLQAEVVY